MNNIGYYHIFFYETNEEGDIELIDEIETKTFDEAIKEVAFCWNLPFEICKTVKHPFVKNSILFKTVARSKEYAQL